MGYLKEVAQRTDERATSGVAAQRDLASGAEEVTEGPAGRRGRREGREAAFSRIGTRIRGRFRGGHEAPLIRRRRVGFQNHLGFE